MNFASQIIYSAAYKLNPDGTRASAAETELQANGESDYINTSWTYDAQDRLTSETVASSLAADNYTDNYTFDLDGNRMSEVKINPATGVNEYIFYTYNGQNQLTQSTSSVSGVTNYSYDSNGNQTNDGTHQYVYDIRNRLIAVKDESGNTLATYGYDDAGDRVSETTFANGTGTTTYYLIDDHNPTGYAQVIGKF